MNLRKSTKALSWHQSIALVALLSTAQISCGGVDDEEQAALESPPVSTVKKDPELGLPVCSTDSQLAPVLPGDHAVERFEFDVNKDGDSLPGVSFLPRNLSGAPTVLVLSGGSIEGSRYDWLGDFLASNGFAVVMVQRSGGGDRLGLPMAMLGALIDAGLEGRINPEQIIVAGHSFGGLNALCLASPDGCPWEVTPDHIPAGLAGVITLMSHAQPFEKPDLNTPMPIERVPVMMIQGTRDGRSTMDEVTATFSRLEGNTERYLVTLTGVNHYQMARCLDLNKDNYRQELAAEVSHSVALERAAKTVLTFSRWIDGGNKVMDELLDNDGIMVEKR